MQQIEEKQQRTEEKQKARNQLAILKILCCLSVLLLTVGRNVIQAKAEGLTINSQLRINKNVMIKDGKVLITQVTDKNGGTATYDVASNTLTLKNFTVSNEGSTSTHPLEEWFKAFCMPEDFRIVLIGKNTIFSNFRYNAETRVEHSIFQLDTQNTVIMGPGSLTSNVCIGGGDFSDLTIQNCDITINGVYGGLYVRALTIENANVNLSVEAVRGGQPYALYAMYLNVKDSNVIAKSLNDIHRSIYIRRDHQDLGSDIVKYTVSDPNDKITLGSDQIVVDEKGAPLYPHAYYFSTLDYFVYSTQKEVSGTFQQKYVSNEVHILSTKKTDLNTKIEAVKAAVKAIGTVTLDSKSAIQKARSAYDVLSSLTTYKDYALGQIASDYEILVKAESSYQALLKASETKKDTNPTGNTSNATTVKHKVVTVKGKKYTIKTPTLKTVKSSKKKTLTASYTTSKTSTGYQIYLSTSKKFKSPKKVLVTKKTTAKKTIGGLKRKKTYYVKVRAYRTIKGKKYYGYFSNVKQIKVK